MDGLSLMRNLGIVAHIDAGKTTVTERMLHCSGVEHRVGQVDDGTAVMDWMAEERERGITITAAATTVPWRDATLNLIDTPGHVDFTVEVERCMRVLDGAVLVIDAVAGVQAQSETVWRQMARNAVPCICFVNKCDRAGADFLAAIESLRVRLGAKAVPLQYPVFEGDAGDGKIKGAVDLFERCTYFFAEGECQVEDGVPEDLVDEVEVLRAELVDLLADEDEALMNAVLEEREPDVPMLKAALRDQVVAGKLVPVFCGAALRGIGVQPLLDAVIAYLPSPLDRPAVVPFDAKTGEPTEPRAADPDLPLTCLAFKLHAGAHGDLTFVRIYSGKIVPGRKIWNPRVKRMERVARVMRMHAESGEAVDVAYAGEIVALTGMKFTGTGDTLCDREGGSVLLEPPTFPQPVIALVVEPSSSGDRDKLRDSLARLAHEDPSLVVSEDESTGQFSIEGMGELHLEVVLHRLRDEFRVESHTGKPRVSYKEAIRRGAAGSGKLERTIGGKELFAVVHVEVIAGEEGAAAEVEWAEDCPIPESDRPAVAEALEAEAQSGPTFGFPLVGARVRVVGAEVREKSEELAFVQAATLALRQALQGAEVVLLEPVMAFEVDTPEDFASGIIADLGGRQAEVGDVLSEGDKRTIRGKVPMIQMFGYSTVVRSLSQGRASFSLAPAGFTQVAQADLEARGLVWT